jgi:hypothetical protein
MKKGLAIIGAIVLAIVAAWLLWYGPYPPWLTESERLMARARRLGTAKFTAEQWRTANPRVRATMVADLLKGHDFIGSRYDAVTTVLGVSTCYADYDDVPCYLVEASNGTRQNLVFGVSHSDRPGTVIDVGLWDY